MNEVRRSGWRVSSAPDRLLRGEVTAKVEFLHPLGSEDAVDDMFNRGVTWYMAGSTEGRLAEVRARCFQVGQVYMRALSRGWSHAGSSLSHSLSRYLWRHDCVHRPVCRREHGCADGVRFGLLHRSSRMRVHSVQSSVSEEFYDQCEREFKLSPATDPAKRIGWLGWRT